MNSDDKIKALVELITDECKKRKFTIGDFEKLYLEIQWVLQERRYKADCELF